MSRRDQTLLACFQEDHAVLGTGFHRLSACLRANDGDGAHRVAQQLDEKAGAHIAFEEEGFYPYLIALLGEEEVARMLAEHAQGLRVIQTVGDQKIPLDRAACQQLVSHSEAMEDHIADCATLFEAMTRLPASQQSQLREKLSEWRQRQPTWTSYAKGKKASRLRVSGQGEPA